ncbi:ABC transporter G member 7 [Lathyrus oleraceus]|uniref:ABC transporter G member 7 n=2 Tax=Pisum sativum TaxID=3888 RepID=A0A9D4VHG8_PEA|nr:ABC transporter G member 7 [Pisum sativum]
MIARVEPLVNMAKITRVTVPMDPALAVVAELDHLTDGPLVKAMKDGDLVLVDEISLSDDSVLERLNSVLELERTLSLAEKGGPDPEKVTETLRQLALDGHTVICSIHQSRGSVYGKFDGIVLLTEDSLVYAGPARDEPLVYFSKFGYLYPDHVNRAAKYKSGLKTEVKIQSTETTHQ